MNENQFFRQGTRGFFIGLVCIVLAIWAVTISANYLYPEDPYCGNMLGAGFPVMFICDDWGGGSPTGSWNKIDFVDVLNGGLLPGGFLIDFLFYFVLIGIIWFTASSMIHKGLNWSDLWWTSFISMGFMAGFLCGFLIFLPSYFNYVRPPLFNVRTPTPALASPTSIGTVPTTAPTITPTATANP